LLREVESSATSDPIVDSHDTSLFGAVRAAVEDAFRLDPVPHNPTVAMGARDLERLVVVVPADLALGHEASSFDGNHAGR
jgi:hypothetical protein